MRLKSKLNAVKYPCFEFEKALKYVDFAPNVDPKAIDPVFLGRYAALCFRLRVKGKINSGYRSIKYQEQLYIKDGGKLVNGQWTGGTGYVGKPGNSWHNYHLALDTQDPVIKEEEKEKATNQLILLKTYGLFKPLTKGNGKTVLEDWHIQPIETNGITDKWLYKPINLDAIQKGDRGEEVKSIQKELIKKGYKIVDDGDFGAITEKAVKDFQSKNGLVADGIVGNQTLSKLK